VRNLREFLEQRFCRFRRQFPTQLAEVNGQQQQRSELRSKRFRGGDANLRSGVRKNRFRRLRA